MTKKSEYIGQYLLKIDSKKTVNKLLDISYDKRIRVVIAMLLYGVTILFVVENKDILFAPFVKLPDGTVLQGSCDFIKAEYMNQRQIKYAINNKMYLTPTEFNKILERDKALNDTDYTINYNDTNLIPKCDCTQNNITEVITEYVYVNVSVSKECICPSCPEVTGKLTDKQNDYLLNDCQLKDGALCYQSGSADTCDMLREYFEVPGRPKYKTRPKATFYTGYNPEPQSTVNFKLIEAGREDKGFYLNNSIWLFSGNGSMIWVHKK